METQWSRKNFRSLLDVGFFPYPIDREVTEKIVEWISTHQDYYEFVDYALGSRSALYKPLPIVRPKDTIPREEWENHVYFMSDKGAVGMEIDFFFLFFDGFAPRAQRYINTHDIDDVTKSLMVYEYKNGTWSVND